MTEENLKANYGPDDMFVTLYYDGEHKPKNKKEAMQELQRFYDRLGENMWSRFISLVVTNTTEPCNDGVRKLRMNLHHHMVINGRKEERDAIIAAWTAGKAVIDTVINDTIDSDEMKVLTMIKRPVPGYKEERHG